ncbi:hypothetical protein V8D89_002017 [Ganoderma adspersum]
MPPSLPIEMAEHAIDFLHDDVHSLAACALASHSLLPAARFHIWRDLTVPIQTHPGPHPRMQVLAEIPDSSSDIAPLIRSLTLKGILSPQPRNRIQQRWDRQPNWNHAFDLGLHQLLPLAYSLPRLEEVAVVGSGLGAAPSRAGMRTPLEALDLSCITRSCNFKYATWDRTDTLPSQAWAPVIGSLGSTLRQCTLGLLAVECYPDNLDNLYGSLNQCTRLRSLGIRWDVSVHPMEATGHSPFVFLRMLADTLRGSARSLAGSAESSAGPHARFPELDTLSIEWLRAEEPVPPGCADACTTLARALEDRSKCPLLRRLDVVARTKRRTPEISAAQREEVAAQEPALRSYFERAVTVGVQLRVELSVD